MTEIEAPEAGKWKEGKKKEQDREREQCFIYFLLIYLFFPWAPCLSAQILSSQEMKIKQDEPQ